MSNLDIESFIDLLELSNLDTTELSDILWLAKYMKTDKRHYITKEKVEESSDYDEIDKKDTKPKEEIKNFVSDEELIETIEESNDYNIPLSVNNKNQETNKAINISHKGYFDDSNQVSKYLIDFKAKTFSKRKKLFDEIKTINYKANTGILNPFFRAKKEKLYTLYLFIDYSSSMNVWKEMIDEYTKLLSNGIFKSIKYVYISSDNSKASFYKDKKLNKLFSPKEITNFHNDKLIFVLTDMLSNGWKNGDTLQVVSKLCNSIPVYIIQMLPYRLWRTTVLKKASITTFNSIHHYPVGDRYNSEIDHLLKSLNIENQKNLKLPIVGFDLAYLKVIGETLKAKENNKIDGAIFNLENTQNARTITERKMLTGQEKVELFFANASTKAQELAKCLSAVQFNIPIMRMIQEKVLKESGNIYIAEVINSGLVNSHDNILEFDDDVYDVLYKLLGRERALEIAYKNSDYIQENLGANFGFKAYLSGEVDLENIDLSENDKKFATISCRILKSMGGEYKDFASKLQKNYINNPSFRPMTATMKAFSIAQNTKNNTALKPIRLVAVGIGGGGGNMIGHMLKEGISGIELLIANTDAQILDQSAAAKKIQLGAQLTKGLGTGMKPAVGKDSALESYDEIKSALKDANIVFILAGLGGGTGTGAAPVIAGIAKELGALTISVVTKPFMFEGKKRMKLAEEGLQELKESSDSIIVIPNDKLLSIIDHNLRMKDSFKIVDSVLAQAVIGISGVILASGDNDINLDLDDLQTVMSHRGMALMGVGEHQGENAAYEAIKSAIESPLLDNMSINGAMGVLVHFHMHPDFPIMELNEAMGVVNDSANEDADVIFGTSSDDTIPKNYVKITIVATGFERELTSNTHFISEYPAPIVPQIFANDRQIIKKKILSVDDNTKDIISDITFECIECGTKHFIGCTDLYWEQVGGSERTMGAEIEYEAEYNETCYECNNDMSITFSCWEYPIGAEGYRDVIGKGIKNLKGDCCLEFNLSDEEYSDDYDGFTVNTDTSYSTLEEKVEELETFINNLIPYSELEFTYDSEDFSNEKDIPDNQFLISYEFDSKYLGDLIDEIQEDINEIKYAIEHMKHDNLANNISNNSLLLKKQYTIEYDGITDAYGIDRDCNIYEEDNEQILYIYPSNKIELDEDILELDQEEDFDLEEAKSDMLVWFSENYDDPVNFLPHDSREGGYQYLYGGPYKLDEILYDQFGGNYSDNFIQKVIEIIEHEHGDIGWAKRPPEDEGYINDYYIEKEYVKSDKEDINSNINKKFTICKISGTPYFIKINLSNIDRRKLSNNFVNIDIRDYGIDEYMRYQSISTIKRNFKDILQNIKYNNWKIKLKCSDIKFGETLEDSNEYLNENIFSYIEYPIDISNLTELEQNIIKFILKQKWEKDISISAFTKQLRVELNISRNEGIRRLYDLKFLIKHDPEQESTTSKLEINKPMLNALLSLEEQNIQNVNVDNIINSKIDGDFEGLSGESIIKLTNGEIWRQSEYYYQYIYTFMPNVTVTNSPTGYKMKIDGINKEVGVEKLMNVRESKVLGSFNGWSGDTIVELINGEKWKQSTYKYSYSYAYSPDVIIYQSDYGFKMKIDGNDETVNVERVV